MYALRIKTAIRGAENEKGNQMSQVQTQDSERRCLLPVLWLPCGGRKKEEEKKEIRHGKLVAVATGKVLAMTQAKDEAFATCAMGDGVVIEPEKGVVVAPADGKITALMKPSLHAIGIETKEGLNLLIHIGIDTVKLDGKGFEAFVKSGQEVKAGDKLVEFDIDLIKKEGYSPDIMVVVLEDSNLPKVAYKTGEKTVAGKTVVAEF